LNLLGILGKAF